MRRCGNCKKSKNDWGVVSQIECPYLGPVLVVDSIKVSGQMAAICKHYEEREELCGDPLISPQPTVKDIYCERIKGHLGDHTKQVGKGRYIWSDSERAPTAFEKALVEYNLDSSARYNPADIFRAGWQALLVIIKQAQIRREADFAFEQFLAGLDAKAHPSFSLAGAYKRSEPLAGCK